MARQTQWLNANHYRKYPFIEDSDLMADTVEVPDSAIVDLRGVSYFHAVTPVRLISVQIIDPGGGSPRLVNFTFRYDGAVVYPTFVFSVPENAAFPFASTVHNSLVHHVTCTFGEGVADLAQNTPGTYALNSLPRVEPALIGFQDKHRVVSVQAEGVGNDELSGIIYLEEGHNCSISVDTPNDRIRIAAEKGAGAGISCETLDPSLLLCPDVLLRINGLRAGDQGGFMLVGMDGVEIVPDPDNHVVVIRAKIPGDEIVCDDCE